MCAVIGVDLVNPSISNVLLVMNVFLESKIRGMHATGLTYLDNNQLVTRIEPVPADQFRFIELGRLNSMINNKALKLIGHCRYSTSDLEYNQPLHNKDVAIVHNGVISQELPENWENLYGIQTKTKNDSELLLHTVNNDPLRIWSNASIAAIELHRTGELKAYRNGKRPLYVTELDNGVIYTSTADIMHRASEGKYVAKRFDFDGKDLQWTID